MLSHLENMFGEVRRFLLAEGRTMLGELGRNPKGDITKEFDLKSEEIAVSYCRKNSLPVEVISEETGNVMVSENPLYTIVLDPVDGSNNFSRGVEWTAFAAAVMPLGHLELDKVKFGLVGNVFTGTIFKAEKGKGAFRNGKKISSSGAKELSKSSLSIALEVGADKQKLDRIFPLVKKIRFARRCGATALDLANVASSGYDGFIDVTDKCTPENFMASCLIIKEAGGAFTDAFGRDFGELEMNKGYNIIAAGNKELHKQILEAVDMNVKK